MCRSIDESISSPHPSLPPSTFSSTSSCSVSLLVALRRPSNSTMRMAHLRQSCDPSSSCLSSTSYCASSCSFASFSYCSSYFASSFLLLRLIIISLRLLRFLLIPLILRLIIMFRRLRLRLFSLLFSFLAFLASLRASLISWMTSCALLASPSLSACFASSCKSKAIIKADSVSPISAANSSHGRALGYSVCLK